MRHKTPAFSGKSGRREEERYKREGEGWREISSNGQQQKDLEMSIIAGHSENITEFTNIASIK